MASQVFDWDGRRYDITRLLDDINNGCLAAELIDLSADFVGKYGQTYLVRGEAGRFAIDMAYVLFKSPDVLRRPAVLLHVGKDRGLITFDEEQGRDANWVIGDGNHRALAAGLHGVGLKAWRQKGLRIASLRTGGAALWPQVSADCRDDLKRPFPYYFHTPNENATRRWRKFLIPLVGDTWIEHVTPAV